MSPEEMKRLVFQTVLTCSLAATTCLGQTDSVTANQRLLQSDKGHWLTLRVGGIAGGTDIGNRWIVLGGYEGRFSRHWSIPIEFQVFQDISYHRSWFMLAAGLKARFQLPRPSTNLYLQAGMSTYLIGPIFYYAAGAEYGLLDRLSIYLQVKRFGSYSDIGDSFITIGININATSERLREKYESEQTQ
jgi:hypothetical protein